MKTPEKKVSEMTGKELTGSIVKGIVGGILTLVAIGYSVERCSLLFLLLLSRN